MAEFRAGQFLVTEAGRDLAGKALRWAQGSPWTHVVLLTSPTTYIEAYPFYGVRVGHLDRVLEDSKQRGRSWLLFDVPGVSTAERQAVVDHAESWVGRRYDYVQALAWWFTKGFWRDGELRMICSRLITAAYYHGAPGKLGFVDPWTQHLTAGRRADLAAGACTPLSLALYSSSYLVATSETSLGVSSRILLDLRDQSTGPAEVAARFPRLFKDAFGSL